MPFIHLSGSRDADRRRAWPPAPGITCRPRLLDSQFAALEPPGPDEALTVDIDQPLDAIVDAHRAA